MDLKNKILYQFVLFTMVFFCSCAGFPTVKMLKVCVINQRGSYRVCGNFDYNYGSLKIVGDSWKEDIVYDSIHRHLEMSPEDFTEQINYIDRVYVWVDKKFKVDPEVERVKIENSPLGLLNEE